MNLVRGRLGAVPHRSYKEDVCVNSPIIIYTTPTCPDCRALKRWLASLGIAYEERDLTNSKIMEEAKMRTGVRVAPITFVGEQFFYGTFADQRPKIAATLGLGIIARSSTDFGPDRLKGAR